MTTNATNWYLDRLRPLVGGTIESLAQDGDYYGFVIKTKEGNRKILFLLSDDEGNAPGSFELLDGGE